MQIEVTVRFYKHQVIKVYVWNMAQNTAYHAVPREVRNMLGIQLNGMAFELDNF